MDRAQDATLTNRGTRQSKRATRVMACTTRRPKCSQGSGRRAASQRRCLSSPQRRTFAQPRRVLDKTKLLIDSKTRGPRKTFFSVSLKASKQEGNYWGQSVFGVRLCGRPSIRPQKARQQSGKPKSLCPTPVFI
jgi:hypothetical protein